MICGIDEAGKGPVIGPLVMAGVNSSNPEIIKLLGVKDSKLLTRAQRELFYDQIIKVADDFKIIIIQPAEIDQYVKNSSLNVLEAHKTAEIINALNPKKVFIDLPDRNPWKYKLNIKSKLSNKEISLITEYKADNTYPIVSAASILAKVTRDREIDKLKQKMGIEFGSGYPADPKTAKFLEENWNKGHAFFRKEWTSWKKFKEKKEQLSLNSFS